MSLFVDKKYINLVSTYFNKFKWTSEKVASCRCVFCGDSERYKAKKRGFFFTKGDTYFYKCHNCGRSFNVYQVLELLNPSLCREYRVEAEWLKDKLDITTTLEPKKQVISKELNITYVADLPEKHKARLYVDGRKIPNIHWNNIAYTEDFSEVAVQLNSDYKDRFFKEDRLLIVIRDKNQIIGIQGRSFSKTSKMKYITLKKYSDEEMYYNISNVNLDIPFYITEGAIDSMFLPNSVATLGVTGFKSIGERIDDVNATYIVDNQPLNKDVLRILKYLVDKGKRVLIFPSKIKEKDINEMVSNGIDVMSLIEKNTFQGLEALVKFNEWKKYEQ